jgi:hypothetical protein
MRAVRPVDAEFVGCAQVGVDGLCAGEGFADAVVGDVLVVLAFEGDAGARSASSQLSSTESWFWAKETM